MKIVGVIPARYDSKRFPGKALAKLGEKSILQHVYERVVRSNVFSNVIVTTDDIRIQEEAKGFGADVVMTPGDFSNGSERVAHVVNDLDYEIVVNIQADQPILPPQVLNEIVEPLVKHPDIKVATPIYPITDTENLNNPNIVKVVIDKEGFALYFSRSLIPHIKGGIFKGESHSLKVDKIYPKGTFYKHIGIYAYRKPFILKYAKFPPGILERTEGLEQLRILEQGWRIKTILASCDSKSVDTKEDLEEIKKEMLDAKF